MRHAVHICLRCNYKWEDNLGPVDCPVCGSPYLKWLNYEDGHKLKEW